MAQVWTIFETPTPAGRSPGAWKRGVKLIPGLCFSDSTRVSIQDLEVGIMAGRAAISCLVALALAACSAPSIIITPRVSRLDIGGDVGAQQGTSVSASASASSLGLEADSSTFGGRVDIVAGAHWTLSAQSSSHGGQGVADAQLSSGAGTINVGDPVDSQFDLALYSGAVTFDLIPTDMFELGIGLGVTALDVDARFTDLSNSATVTTSEILPVPFLAGRLGFKLGACEVSGLLGWIHINYDGDEASFLDFDGMARVRVLGDGDRVAGYLALGYRFLNVQAEYADNGNAVDVDVDFDGPWVGLSLSF